VGTRYKRAPAMKLCEKLFLLLFIELCCGHALQTRASHEGTLYKLAPAMNRKEFFILHFSFFLIQE
jgi:hypothetical protein